MCRFEIFEIRLSTHPLPQWLCHAAWYALKKKTCPNTKNISCGMGIVTTFFLTLSGPIPPAHPTNGSIAAGSGLVSGCTPNPLPIKDQNLIEKNKNYAIIWNFKLVFQLTFDRFWYSNTQFSSTLIHQTSDVLRRPIKKFLPQNNRLIIALQDEYQLAGILFKPKAKFVQNFVSHDAYEPQFNWKFEILCDFLLNVSFKFLW